MKILIINADDFGASHGVNWGIIRAHTEGILTSTSLMVRQPAAEEACALSREFPRLGVGLHLDLGEWALRDGQWVARYERVDLTNRDAVHAEVWAQFEAFRRLLGREPTHLDSHQHVHLDEPLRSVAGDLARQLGIPLRRTELGARYCGDFYGQNPDGTTRPDLISTMALERILGELPDGVTELCCHPAESEDLDTMYLAERTVELEALCAEEVRAVIQRDAIMLSSFAGWGNRDFAATYRPGKERAIR